MTDGMWRWAEGPPEPLEDVLRRAWANMLREPGRPDVEIHNPRCPKILTNGAKACRCGGAPLEALLADEIDALPPR